MVERMWWNCGGGVVAKKKKSERFLVGWVLRGKITRRERKMQFSFFCKW